MAWRRLCLLASALFLTGVVAQVFLAGMVVVAGQMGWANHRDLGHGLGLPLLVMLVTVYLGRMPRGTKRLTWLLALLRLAGPQLWLTAGLARLGAVAAVAMLFGLLAGPLLVSGVDFIQNPLVWSAYAGAAAGWLLYPVWCWLAGRRWKLKARGLPA